MTSIQLEALPATQTLTLEPFDLGITITLNRPDSRNAMSLQMVSELQSVFSAIEDQEAVRAVVLRGANGHFCAGGDIKDMAGAPSAAGTSSAAGASGSTAGAGEGNDDPHFKLNRQFGHLITQVDRAPQVVIALLEGAVLGGGFGLACVSDLAIAHQDAQFGLPETGLGIVPAQIAPFVVTRVGLTQARRLALFGMRFNGIEAQRVGVVHEVVDSSESLEEQLKANLKLLKRCAPNANRVTKALIQRVGQQPMDDLLDQAAHSFSAAVRGEEGHEGTLAFVEKRRPYWANS